MPRWQGAMGKGDGKWKGGFKGGQAGPAAEPCQGEMRSCLTL